MIAIQSGDSVLVPFPFSDLSGAKSSPALVLAVIQDDSVAAAITGNDGCLNKFDFKIREWEEIGLLKPSVIRVGRLFAIHQEKVMAVIGHLGEKEFAELKEMAKTLFSGVRISARRTGNLERAADRRGDGLDPRKTGWKTRRGLLRSRVEG